MMIASLRVGIPDHARSGVSAEGSADSCTIDPHTEQVYVILSKLRI